MAQPSRTGDSYHETHPGSLDPSHHFHPSSSHTHHPATLHRPNHSESPQHGMFQQPSQHHAGFHQQNESQHFRESSDFHDSAFSHHSSQQDRAHISSNTPHSSGGSHPPAESQHSGGPQSGSHIEPHSHQNDPSRRPSNIFSHTSHGGHHGKSHGHNYERSQHLDPQHNRGRHTDSVSHHSFDSHHEEKHHHRGDPHHEEKHHHRGDPHHEEKHHHSSESHHEEKHHHRGDPHHEEKHHHRGDPHHEGHRPGLHHGHHPHRQHHGDHHREHVHHHTPSTSQLSHKSHSTVGTSPSHLGSKSTTSVPRSFFGMRSHISSHVHSKETLKESVSWSDEDHGQKRKKAQRTHKKTSSRNIFQLLWEKISHLLLGLRQMLLSLTQSLGFETFIFLVVCLNTIILVAQTFTELEIRGEWYFMVLDSIFLSIYVLEAFLKLIALGLEYFYDPWNNLDFFIMVMAVLDFVLLQINSLSYSFYNHSLFRILKVFKSMRALRAIRVLRRLSILTSLHEVTGTLSGSLPSITAILILMFTCLFLFSVVLRALFQNSDPKRFQNIFTTLFTLFTMLTLDDWSLIYIDNRAEGAWYIIPILMIYIIIQYFIFLNLVIAVLVDNFQMALLKGLEKVKLEQAARVHEKLLEESLTDLNKADADAQMTEEALKMQLIERMFGNMTENVSVKWIDKIQWADEQRELHFQFLQLVAAVEQHQQKFRSQASVIDELVDIAFEAGDDDYGK